MKKVTVLLLIVFALLISCSTMPSLSDSDLNERAISALGGPSKVEPMQMTLEPDFVAQRLMIYRVRDQHGGAVPNRPLGLYFGNGLFLDNADNLSIRADKILRIDDKFSGATKFSYHIFNGLGMAFDETETTNYALSKITVTEPQVGFEGKNYTINPNDEKISISGWFPGWVLTKMPNSGYNLKAKTEMLSGSTWTKTDFGYRYVYQYSAIGRDTTDFVINGNLIVDNNIGIRIENNGTYLRFAFTRGMEPHAWRIYRTSTRMVIMDERNGNMVVADITPDHMTWGLSGEAGAPKPSAKLLMYKLEISPPQQ